MSKEMFSRNLAKLLRKEADRIEGGLQPQFPPPDEWGEGEDYTIAWNVVGRAVDDDKLQISIRVTRGAYEKVTRMV